MGSSPLKLCHFGCKSAERFQNDKHECTYRKLSTESGHTFGFHLLVRNYRLLITYHHNFVDQLHDDNFQRKIESLSKIINLILNLNIITWRSYITYIL